MTHACEQTAFSSVNSNRSVHRADIDGLRALAVTAVVLFHADLLPGGFIGVDIFFVISGYLMASIVVHGLEEGRFSLVDFYARRVRRIVPALAVVMALIAIAGSLLMLPHDIKELGRSIVAASTFTSNLWFRDIAADYFSAENVLYQPMLHSWSLAVEAQFYVLFPLVMMAGYRWLGRKSVYVLCALALASLAYSIHAVAHDPQAAFYLLASRMWELLAGAVVFFLPKPHRFHVPLAFAGLCAIAIALVIYHPEIGFPGWKALLPVAGAAAILCACPGMETGWTQRFLGSAPVEFLGKTSYSLYLWHWPLFVFARYNMGPVLPVWLDAGLIVLAVFLAWLSWRFVEQPFLRGVHKTSPWKRIAAPLAMICALVAVGAVVKNVVPKYAGGVLPPTVMTLAEAERDYIKDDCAPEGGNGFPCRFGAMDEVPSVIVWGNSFARMWMKGIDTLARERGYAGSAAIMSSCSPLAAGNVDAACTAFNRQVMTYIKKAHHVNAIVLAADWQIRPGFAQSLETLVSTLYRDGKKVYVVLRPPYPGYSVPRALALSALRDSLPPSAISYTAHDKERQQYLDILVPLVKRYGMVIIDPADRLCADDTCIVQAGDGTVLYYDRYHVTQSGAVLYRDLFNPVFPD